MYYDMIKEKVGPAVLEVYPEGNAIFQDDAASIHRTVAALQAVFDTFRFRLENSSQAPKTADIWPVENVWGMIKSKISKKKCENKDDLKKELVKSWRELDSNKDLCRRLVGSIPKRLEAVVMKSGRQIFKSDH